MYGSLEQNGDRWELRFTRHLAHPPEKVWRALTEPEHLRAWFPADIEGERKQGAMLRFVFREDEAPTIEGEMLRYDPPRLLELRWADETLRFELVADGDGTMLTFVNRFDELGKAARDAAGWHACLDALGSDLDGTAPSEKRWSEVHQWYVEHFGPDAAAIGPPEGMEP